jgi:hypothetical protein
VVEGKSVIPVSFRDVHVAHYSIAKWLCRFGGDAFLEHGLGSNKRRAILDLAREAGKEQRPAATGPLARCARLCRPVLGGVAPRPYLISGRSKQENLSHFAVRDDSGTLSRVCRLDVET